MVKRGAPKKNVDKMEIGKRIKESRNIIGISQNELAEILGRSNQSISNWECGISTPPKKIVKMIAEICGVYFESIYYTEKNSNIERKICMKCNEYQALAARTINNDLSQYQKEMHALHGMAGEVGEIHSIYQKEMQGHPIDKEHLKKECGDLLWFVAEYCTAYGWDLEEIMQMNIDKLKARFPEGFEAERSLHRKEGDI